MRTAQTFLEMAMHSLGRNHILGVYIWYVEDYGKKYKNQGSWTIGISFSKASFY